MTSTKLVKSKPPKDVPSVISRIAPVTDSQDGLTALFYGRAGTGKTTLLGTFPKPLLLIDIAEKGTRSVRKVKGIDAVTITQWDEYEELYHWIKRKGQKYISIGNDPISGLQNLAIDRVRADGKSREDLLMSRKQWGQVSGMMKTWLGHYRDLSALGKNVIFTAHERVTSDDDSSGEDQLDPSVGAQVMPSVASFIAGAVEVVGHTFIHQKTIRKDGKKITKMEYALRLGPHAYYNTKIRTPKENPPPDYVVNANFEKILKITQGEFVINK